LPFTKQNNAPPNSMYKVCEGQQERLPKLLCAVSATVSLVDNWG